MGLLGQAQRGTYAVNIFLKWLHSKDIFYLPAKPRKNIYVIFENVLRIGDLTFLKLYQTFLRAIVQITPKYHSRNSLI